MQSRILRKLCVWLLAAVGCGWAMGNLVACHTVEGAGEDIESAGHGIQNAAD